jgi:hypothetical protein
MQRRVAILAVFVALGSLLVLIATKLNPESRPEWRARTIPQCTLYSLEFHNQGFQRKSQKIDAEMQAAESHAEGSKRLMRRRITPSRSLAGCEALPPRQRRATPQAAS